MAFRSLLRPSSLADAQASTVRPLSLDHLMACRFQLALNSSAMVRMVQTHPEACPFCVGPLRFPSILRRITCVSSGHIDAGVLQIDMVCLSFLFHGAHCGPLRRKFKRLCAFTILLTCQRDRGGLLVHRNSDRAPPGYLGGQHRRESIQQVSLRDMTDSGWVRRTHLAPSIRRILSGLDL